MNIIGLFPIPVFQNKINFNLDIDKLVQQLSFSDNEGGNSFSNQQYILNIDELSELKKLIKESLQSYRDNVINPEKKLQIYITNSWLNISKQGNKHHKHSHVNSLISGVYYVKTGSNDSITFYHNRYDQIKIYPKEYNIFNSDSWTIPVSSGDLLLFPSYLDHGVTSCHNDIRISLAFNTFIRGSIGNSSSSTHLELN